VDTDGTGGLVELPEGEGAADGDADPENDEHGCRVFSGETVPEVKDVAAVVDAKPCSNGVADGAADGEGDHEFFSRHVERACSEDEGAQRHGRRKDGGEGDGEDGVALHPVAYALEDACGDVFFEEGHAAALTDLVAKISAECGACGCKKDEQDDVLLAGGHHDDHDVGDAGHGQRDEGAVDNGDEEDAEDAEAEEQVHKRAAGAAMNCCSLGCGCDEVLRRVDGRREELHT